MAMGSSLVVNRTVMDIFDRKIMVVLRNIGEDDILGVARALSDGGIQMLEITFDQSKRISDETTASMIKRIREMFGQDMLVGAGTVLSTRQVKLAKEGGASFVVTVDTNPDVIQKTVSYNMAAIPGAMTPTEILLAHRSGASIVKVFPCSSLGVDYFKSVKKPLSDIELMAFGGINLQNIQEFLDAGARCVGINSGIVDPEFVRKKDYKAIESRARAFVDLIKHQ